MGPRSGRKRFRRGQLAIHERARCTGKSEGDAERFETEMGSQRRNRITNMPG